MTEILVPEIGSVIEIKTIDEARKLENGQIVTIEGTATVIPGILSNNFFYIEDGTGGIQIYNYHKDFPALKKGVRIRVTGELSETSGEKRMKTDDQYDIVILEEGSIVEPQAVSLAEVNESLEGQFVKIKGKISQTSGSTFIVEEEGNQVKIIIKSGTNIKKPRMRKGDIVEISGIISHYKNEYRILPIEQGDVKIISSSLLPKAGGINIIYPLIAILLQLSWNIFQRLKKKHSVLHEVWFKRLARETSLLCRGI